MHALPHIILSCDTSTGAVPVLAQVKLQSQAKALPGQSPEFSGAFDATRKVSMQPPSFCLAVCGANRLHACEQHATPHTWCMQTLASEGVRGLFRGMAAPLATVALFNAVLFATRGQMERLLAHPDGRTHAWQSYLPATPGLVHCALCKYRGQAHGWHLIQLVVVVRRLGADNRRPGSGRPGGGRCCLVPGLPHRAHQVPDTGAGRRRGGAGALLTDSAHAEENGHGAALPFEAWHCSSPSMVLRYIISGRLFLASMLSLVL